MEGITVDTGLVCYARHNRFFVTYLSAILVFEFFHQPLHVPQLSIQFDFVIVDHIKLPAQIGHIGLKHGLNVRSTWGLTLQNFPLGLQYLVLLLQEPHLLIEINTKEDLLKRSGI